MGTSAPLALPYNVMQWLRRHEKYEMEHWSVHDLRKGWLEEKVVATMSLAKTPQTALLSLCESWEHGNASFADVLNVVPEVGISFHDVAEALECTDAVVQYWAGGAVEPDFELQRVLVQQLRERAASGSVARLSLAN